MTNQFADNPVELYCLDVARSIAAAFSQLATGHVTPVQNCSPEVGTWHVTAPS